MIVEKDKGEVMPRISFPMQNILKIQEAAIKDPSLRILPAYKAQGSKHQWVLPTGANETWRQLRSAYPELRKEILDRIEAARSTFAAVQTGSDSAKVNNIYATPDNDEFVYYKTEFDGTLTGVAVAGWGFRYPAAGQNSGVIMEESGSNIQKVRISMIDGGSPARSREFRYGLVSRPVSKMGSTDSDGKFNLGNFSTGIEFFVFDMQTGKNFIFTVKKGEELYVCDVTQEKSEEQKPDEERKEEKTTDDDHQTGEKDDIKVILPPPYDPKKKVYGRLRVVVPNGAPVAGFPVFIHHAGEKYRVFSDRDGYLQLPEMLEKTSFSVTDGFSDLNRRDYDVSADQETYVYPLDFIPVNGNRDVSVLIIDEKGKPVCRDYVVLNTGASILRCIPDEKGRIYLDDRYVERNVLMKFTLVRDTEEISTDDFMLIPGEQDYTVQLDSKGTPWWQRLLEVVCVVASIIGILYFFGLIINVCDAVA